MSSEPTDDELTAAEVRYWHGENTRIKDALTAANALRDRRIRNEALEEAALVAAYHADDRPRRDEMHWNDGYMDGCAGAAEAIRALKDKTDDPAPE